MEAANDPVALYVHFPWCVAKCPYCDFNSHPLRGTLDEDNYLSALERDLTNTLTWLDQVSGTTRSISSVFFGGGTPSLFQPASFAQLMTQIAPRLVTQAEVTMEANPGTTEHSDFGGYLSAGINRLSLGAQSFDDGMLKRLGRIHSSANTMAAFDNARQAGFMRINVDIMYALPEQSVQQALDDVQAALALEPEHLSWYQLTLEPRTEFYRRPPLLPVETITSVIEREGRGRIADAGLSRYEVSAYARSGERSSHNLCYWQFGDYLGVGAGAHGKVRVAGQSLRTAKPSQPRLYLKDPLTRTDEPIPADAMPVEFAMNALRLTDGVTADAYHQNTGRPLADIEPVWQQLQRQGLMRADRFAATARGFEMLDSLVSEFL